MAGSGFDEYGSETLYAAATFLDGSGFASSEIPKPTPAEWVAPGKKGDSDSGKFAMLSSEIIIITNLL